MALLFLALRRDSLPWAYLVVAAFTATLLTPMIWWANVSVGTLPWLALAVAEALVTGFAGLAWVGARRWLPRRGPAWRRWTLQALAFAVIWVAGEELRSEWPFGGFPWGRLAFSQAGAPSGRLAWLGGVPLVSFAIAFAGAALAVALLAVSRRRWRTAALGVAGAIALVTLPGLIPLATAAEDGDLAVGAVQGDVPGGSNGAETRMRGVIANHVAGTEALVAQVGTGALDLVVWPENASDLWPLADADAAAEIDAAARDADAPILLGAIEYLPGKTRKNVSILWSPGVGVIDSYAKQHPAPFAEYIPIRGFVSLFSDKVDLVVNEMVPGVGVGVIDVPVARLGRDVEIADVICFEVLYDALVRDAVDAGGELIVVQTNNASFGYTDEGAQQFAMTRMRAIEHGRAAIQISTVGVSGLIAPDGSVLDSGGLFTAEQFHAALPLRTSSTPATSTAGPASATALVIGAAALAAAICSHWWTPLGGRARKKVAKR